MALTHFSSEQCPVQQAVGGLAGSVSPGEQHGSQGPVEVPAEGTTS